MTGTIRTVDRREKARACEDDEVTVMVEGIGKRVEVAKVILHGIKSCPRRKNNPIIEGQIPYIIMLKYYNFIVLVVSSVVIYKVFN